MSRYPGSTFRVIDNSNTSAYVPIQTVNPAAPIYLTAFRSVKGPEIIANDIYGQTFYDLYGSQDTISFKKYGQPLLQAAMNINGGARLIAKRVVLDDAHLANATVGIVLTKQPSVNVTSVNKVFTFKDGSSEELPYFETPVFDASNSKFVCSPLVISNANSSVRVDEYTEKKDIYHMYRNAMISSSVNVSNTNLKKIKLNAGDSVSVTATSTDYDGVTLTNVHTYQISDTDTVSTPEIKNGYNMISGNLFSIDKTAESVTLNVTSSSTFDTYEDYEAAFNADILAIYNATQNASTSYYFPLFSIFDNGRGVSTKSFAILYDAETSKTLKKAVYTLKIINTSTDKTLESFSFTLDPTVKNNNTGYSFDIESAVNPNSNQVNVKFHNDSFDKLLNIMIDNIMCDESIFATSDILFGHRLDGSYPGYPTIATTNGYNKKKVYIYDYSNIQIDGYPNLYVDVLRNSDNLSASDTNFKYYFYNYPYRSKLNISEKLEFGTDGMDLARKRVDASGAEIESKYPLVVVFDENIDEPNMDDALNNGSFYENVDLEPIYRANFKEYSVKKNAIVYSVSDDGALTKIELTKSDIIYIPKSETELYDEQYTSFFRGEFDKDIYNLDIYFPTIFFDANYADETKLAVQELAAYRGDFLAYMDMGIRKVASYEQVYDKIPNELEGQVFGETTKPYIRDMHVAVTCIYYDIRDPFTNRQIPVTATYSLSLAFINHYITGPGKVFAGINNGIIMTAAINGTVNYIPKIYPTNAMTSLANIGMTYPSEDNAIINEKQLMCDLRINYGSYYENTFVMDTEYTLNPTNSEYSYINNVLLVCRLMQDIRKSCPASRYNFIDTDDLETYEKAVTNVINAHSNNFASVKFKYVNDENSVANKIYYAAIEVVFRPFAQAEIFTITALNYSTLSENVTSV